jgi:hypothetical protein
LEIMSTTQGSDAITETVQFNVGGKVYEVSKSLLNAFPDTLLATKASTVTVSPIFVDRDPDRFAYCLDFMRDNGKVHLTENVSKAALLKELKYFGFADIDRALISDTQSKRQTPTRITDIMLESRQKITAMKQEIHSLEQKIKLESIAVHLFIKFLKDPRDGGSFLIGSKGCPFEGKLPAGNCGFTDNVDFRQCLGKYGLHSKRNDKHTVNLSRRQG